jgi:hypothetical protein
MNQWIAVQGFDKKLRSANTGPGVVPESRDQPRSILRKEQVREDAVLRSDMTGSPGKGLLGTRGDQYVGPAPIKRHSRGVIEDNTVGARLEIAQPPWLVSGELRQLRYDSAFVRLDCHSIRFVAGGVRLEGRWDRRSYRQVSGRPVRNPADFAGCPDLPASPVLERLHPTIKQGAAVLVALISDVCHVAGRTGRP